MKGTLLSILALIIFCSAGFAQEGDAWKWSHQQPQGNVLRWVKMWDDNNWYAVGYGGTFMKTTNGGATWNFNHKAGLPDPVTEIYESIYDADFWDMNNGVITGGGGLAARTTDGGETWTASVVGASTVTWYNVHFINPNVGYIVGTTSGRLAKTTDGGLTWVLDTIIPAGTYYDVYAFDENKIIVASSAGNIRRTTDAGLTWETILTGTSVTLYRVNFMDANNGWVSGSSGSARYTTDGGTTWTSANTGLPSTIMYDIDFSTTFAGPLSQGFEDVTFPPAGWKSVNVLGAAEWVRSTAQAKSGAASAYMVYQSTGGEDWLISPSVSVASGNSLKFSLRKYYTTSYPPDSLIVMVSTTDTALASFTNRIFAIDVNTLTDNAWDTFTIDLTAFAGQTIYVAFQHKNFDGNGVYLDDVAIGVETSAVFLTGDSFNIYKSVDMGTTWTTVAFLGPVANQPWTSTYYATSFNGENFVTVGAAGLMNSKVGASAPVAHTLYMKAGILYDVWAESTTGKVIAVGAPGNATAYDQIIYSTNGGQSWTKAATSDAPQVNTVQYFSEDELELVTTSVFRAIDMINSNVGFVAGQNGSLYKTTNGGIFWDSIATTAGSIYFYDVDFIDENTGWVVGASGNCWKTTDGGATWTQQTTTLTGIIYSIDMVNANYGWLAGASGNVNITTDGGTTWTAQTSGMGTSTIYGVAAINLNTAFVAGASGKIARTTDAGATWELLTVPTQIGTSIFYAIDFRGPHGVATGSLGKIAATSDGGNTWWYAYNNGGTTYGVRIAEQGSDTTSVFTVGATGAIHKNSMFVVPVEFTSFTSAVSGNTVTLNWTTATEKNNSGFSIERKTETTEFETVGFVSGNGTTTKISNYSYSDKVETGKYIYRLKQIDYDGSFAYSSEIEAEVEVPTVYALEQNYPNPFNPSTIIRYSVPVDGFVTLSIYNALGEKVASLVNQQVSAGVYEVDFNASSFASGIYFYRLDAGNFVSIKKMMLLK
jgi:photosystem II stability/assembly factor-like uncharacterized protein